MFPNFSYFAHYFFGIPPDGAWSVLVTYGFFFMLAVYSNTVLFKGEMRRKELLGFLGTPPQSGASAYNGIFTDSFLNAHTLIAVGGGLVGTKLLALLEVLPAFLASPQDVFFKTGIVFYGGIIGGTLTSYLFFRRRKIPFIHVLDAVCPALFLANGIGRMGCQLSGDGCWGVVASAKPSWWFLPDWMWSFDFPHNVGHAGKIIEGCTFRYHHVLETRVFPTSFYETVVLLTLFALLWRIRKKVKPAGLLFGVYLALNGLERFFIEFIRVNKKYDVFGFALSQAQIIALMLMLSGAIVCFVVLQKKEKIRI
jgi:phosphatidylglycerol---prolipoprotein diacylglyceryl transferase